MAARAQPLIQQWLPGLEPTDAGLANERVSARGRGSRRFKKSTVSVDKLVAKLPQRNRSLILEVRAGLQRLHGVTEGSSFDDTAAAYIPTFAFKDREVLRLHLEPILAATLVLEPGDRLLAALMKARELSDRLKTQIVRGARKSGRRVFLSLPSRTEREIVDLLSVVRARVALG